MAIVLCRECKKQVSNEAPACPHCGVPKPAPDTPASATPAPKKGTPTWAKWLGGIAIVGALVSGMTESKKPADAQSAPASATSPNPASSQHQASALDFGITPQQFRDAYNGLLSEKLGRQAGSLTLRPLTVTQGESADSFKQEIPDAATYIIGRVSKKTGKMDDLMIGIGGGGTAKAANAIGVAVLAVRSASGLDAQSGVTKAVTGLLNEAADQLKDPDQSPTARTVGGYKLNAVGIKDVGILLSLSRAK